jgi:hypothetical protein
MLIGAHVSIRGGVQNAVDNAAAIGADVVQTHPTPAVMWRPRRLDEEVRAAHLQRYLPGEQGRGPDLVNINRIRECAGLAPKVLEPVAAGGAVR